MDYYNMKNLQSDTEMRNSIAGIRGSERNVNEMSLNCH